MFVEEEPWRRVGEIERVESSGAEERPRVVEGHEDHDEPTQAVDRHVALARRRRRGLR